MLPHELSNNLGLRILGNQEITRKSLKWFDLMTIIQPTTQKPNFDVFGKISQKSAVKHPIEKSILLNFVNLSTTLCLGLSEEI